MSTLYLIRHGQASFGAADYDVLSERGVEQARALGDDWAGKNLALDALYMGPRKRHADTTASFSEAARERGMRYPEPVCLPEFDEYPAMELLQHWLPKIAAAEQTGEQAGERVDGQPSSRAPLSDKRRFERLFERIIHGWSTGELATDHLESFVDFRARVVRGLRHVMDTEGRKKTVAVVTSGGPICMALQMALELSDKVAVRQGWVIGNGSVSEFRYRTSELITLVGFNNASHLARESLITYR